MSAPIGVLDSGVGGLSVLRHIQATLPHEQLLYVADQAHIPYGPRPLSEIQQFSVAITRFLVDKGAKLIVVACNTASGAALTTLREQFPDTSFVGMEPAIKPAVAQTRNRRIGVLATQGTFESQRYARLLEQYAQGVLLWQDPCLGLVPLIEAGQLDTPATANLLQKALTPMLASQVDTLILGCTHYPFVLPLLRRLVGPEMSIIDPAPAVARQTARLLPNQADGQGTTHAFTSGEPAALKEFAMAVGVSLPVITGVRWTEVDKTLTLVKRPD